MMESLSKGRPLRYVPNVSSAGSNLLDKRGYRSSHKLLGMGVVEVVVVVELALPKVLVGHLDQLVLEVLQVLEVLVVLQVQHLRVVQLVQLELLVVLVVLRVLGLLVVLLVLEVQLVQQVLGHRGVLGLLVVLVEGVGELVLQERSIRVDKREHRRKDMERRTPLAISCPFHVGFQPYIRQ